MVIRVFFTVLVLCTAAVVAVVLALHLRVKRHLREQPPTSPAPEAIELTEPVAAQVEPETAEAAEHAAEEKRPE